VFSRAFSPQAVDRFRATLATAKDIDAEYLRKNWGIVSLVGGLYGCFIIGLIFLRSSRTRDSLFYLRWALPQTPMPGLARRAQGGSRQQHRNPIPQAARVLIPVCEAPGDRLPSGWLRRAHAESVGLVDTHGHDTSLRVGLHCMRNLTV
jgi:hypothetical protein